MGKEVTKYSLVIQGIIWMVRIDVFENGIYLYHEYPFTSTSITDCYTWIKAKEEGLLS